MFDGPHAERDQYDGVVLAQPALDKSHVLIVDDWNLSQVRDGTMRALIDTRCRIDAWIEVRTTFDNTHPSIATSTATGTTATSLPPWKKYNQCALGGLSH